MNNIKNFSLVFCVKDTDFELLTKNINTIIENINPKDIIIISSNKLLSKKDNVNDFIFLNEDSIFEGMSFKSISNYIEQFNSDTKLTGWYFQQFLKMAFCYYTNNEYYLVWDADTIPLKKISFFTDNLKPIFDLKREYEKKYFDTINCLLSIKKTRNESFISEHMLFNTNIMKSLISDIENNNSIIGNNFWQKILNACKTNNINSQNFSEFETYGTYVETKFPNFYETRKLSTLRYGTFFLGNSPTIDTMKWASNSFDIISFEHWDKPYLLAIKKSTNEKYKKFHSLTHMIKEILLYSEFKLFISRLIKLNIKDLLFGKSFKSGFRSDFFFYKNPEYKYIKQ